jgi:hypothetical protein
MLAQHLSQREWLREQHGIDVYIDAMRCWGHRRGTEATALASRNIGYAEAFPQHVGHAYPHNNVLESLLGPNLTINYHGSCCPEQQ